MIYMKISEVREYLIEFQRSTPPLLVPRDFEIRSRTTLIDTIVGPRRAGKTYLLHQLMSDLEKKDVAYLNFEDTRLLSVTFNDFLDVINLHAEIAGNEPRYILFDEPQYVEGWEKGVRTLFDRRRYRIVVTGSSSKLLGAEIATHLRGRAIKHLLLPFDFREFLRAGGVEIPKLLTGGDKASIKNSLNAWLEFGGYPEVVKSPDATEKMKLLEGYKDLIIFRDIIDRYRIRSSFIVKLLLESLVSNFAREFSVNGFYNTLKSRNIKVSKKTLYLYLSYIEDSISMFVLERWSPKLKEQKLAPKKVYLCDSGLAFKQREDRARLMENAVFLELKRAQSSNPMIDISYWRDHQQREVDFVVRSGSKAVKLLQVTDADDRDGVRKREVANLLIAGRELRCRNLEVITWAYEETRTRNGKKIVFTPLWKWLLERVAAKVK
jgi:predicted AAA+ superfamily ATPase